MDPSVIAIAVVGTLIFFGVIAWKAVWFFRKMTESEAQAAANADAAEREGRQS